MDDLDEAMQVPAGWGGQGYEDAVDGMCALLAAVAELDNALTCLPVAEPAAICRMVAKVRASLEFIESSANNRPS